MKLPADFSSNVYCLENAAFISWSVFEAKTSDGDGDDDSILRSHMRLEAVSRQLLQNDHLIFHNAGARLIWTFQLPSDDSRQREKNAERLSRLAHDQKLSRTSSGRLFANDPARLSKRPQPSSTNIRSVASNLPSPMSDAFKIEDASDQVATPLSSSFGRHDVYDAFLSALLYTLSFRLCLERSMIPMCYNVLVYDPYETDDGTFYDLWGSGRSDRSSRRKEGPRKWSSIVIGVDWLLDGKIVLMYRRNPTEYLSLEDTPSSVGKNSEAIIAPLGLRLPSSNVGVQSTNQSRKRQQRQQQAIVSALRLKGVRVSEDPRWIRCSLQDPSAEDGPDELTRYFMWPEELIFICQMSTPVDPMPCWIDPELVEDPLRVINALQSTPAQEVAAERPDAHQMHPTESDLVDPYAAILDGLLNLPGGVGIYPTPPELTRSQAPLHRDRMDFSAPTPATTASGHAYSLDDGVTPLGETNDQIFIESNETNEDDDLFSDFGVDFSREELNDDEFGFFDASKAGDLVNNLEDQIAAHDPSSDIHMSDTDRRSKEKTVSFDVAEADRDDDAGIRLTSHFQSTEDPASESVPVSETSPNFTFSPKSVQSDHSITHPLDDKYQSGGLFGALKPNGPSTLTPRAGITFTRTIPIITVTDRHQTVDGANRAASDTESTSETSDSEMDVADTSDEDGEDVMESQSDTSIGEDPQTSKAKGVPAFELFCTRVPLLLVAPGHNKALFRYVSHNLKLDEAQSMELSRLVESQVSSMPPDGCVSDRASTRTSQDTKSSVIRGSGGNLSRNPVAGHFLMDDPSDSYRVEIDNVLDGIVDKIFATMYNQTVRDCATFENDMNRKVVDPARHDRMEVDITAREVDASLLRVPQVVVRRDAIKSVMSASALSLWNELGIGPLSGGVDIVSYCFTPRHDSWTRGAATLLQMLHEAFLTLRLGSHNKGDDADICDKDNPGVVSVDAGNSFQAFFHNMCQSLSGFGQVVSRLDDSPRTFAVYMVNTVDDLSAVPSFCAAFQKLQGLLEEKCSTRHHLILKIIPRSWIIHDLSFGFLPRQLIQCISREMYCRCLQAESGETDASFKPITRLARPIPKSITFSLSRDHIYNPLRPTIVTHVAYSWTPGNPWLSFAYCDDTGERQWHVSYHVPWEKTQQQGGHGQQVPTPSRPSSGDRGVSGSPRARPSNQGPQASMWQRFVGVARDVLANLVDVSEDIAASGHARIHNVVLVKDGPMLRQEEIVWKSLTEKCAKPGGVASILGMGGGGESGGHDSHVVSPTVIKQDGSRVNRPTSRRHIYSTMINFTIAILDPDCPIQLQSPQAWWNDPPTDPPDHNHSTPFTQDLPASTPGTPSLASPGFAGIGGAGFSAAGHSHRDLDSHGARLVRVTNLAWFVPARSILVQTYTGKLETIPTPTIDPPQGPNKTPGAGSQQQHHQQPQRPQQIPVSGGGYLLINGSDTSNGGSGDGRASAPTVLSLRIVAAKAPSPYPTVRDLAQAYRGLTTISDVCGMVGTRLPWHVATARRSRIGLGRCM